MYERDIVREETVDLTEGIRMLYGDPGRQKEILDACEKRVPDMDIKPWIFPPYTGSNYQLEEILKSTDFGIVLKINARHDLRVTRLCQSRVFYFQNTDDGLTSTKMERQIQMELFSYHKYIRRLIQCQRDNINEEQDCETVLVIGTKPSTRRSGSLVSVIIEPVVSDKLTNQFSDSAWSLHISQKSSLDDLIRTMDNFDFSRN